MTKQPVFEFTLLLDGIDDVTDAQVDALYEAGCDDGTISVHARRVSVAFDREADSLAEAIGSAIADIRRANIQATVLRIDTDDMVTQADIARRAGCSRQLVSQFVSGGRGPGGFPAPVRNFAGKSLLWNWREAAMWLAKNNHLKQAQVEEIALIDAVNRGLEWKRVQRESPELARELDRVLQDA